MRVVRPGRVPHPVVLVDGAGGLLAEVDDWDEAHSWAHKVVRTRSQDVRLPLVVWDLRPDQGRRVAEVDASGCRAMTWQTCLMEVPGGEAGTVAAGGGEVSGGERSASRRELALRSVDLSWRAARRALEALVADLGTFGEVLPVDAVTSLALTRRAGQLKADIDALRLTARGTTVTDEDGGSGCGP